MPQKPWKTRLRRFLCRTGLLSPDPFPHLDSINFPDLQRKTGFALRKEAFLKKKDLRVLYNISWMGGVGGLERSSQAFIQYLQTQGCEIDIVYETRLPAGHYPISENEGTNIYSLPEFKRLSPLPGYDLFYSQPTPGFDSLFWGNYLKDFQGIKIINWQKHTPQWLKRHIFDFDLIHAESTFPCRLPSFAFICPPPLTPFRTVASPFPDLPFPRYYLSVFNPYGKIKGLPFLKQTLDQLDHPLVWCYDLKSFSRAPERLNTMRHEIALIDHPLLFPVEGPTEDLLHQLYQHCKGYICFSEYESYGWSITDAIDYQKPVAARNVGILREVRHFQPLSDPGPLIFNEISGPCHRHDFLESLRSRLTNRFLKSSFRFQAKQAEP